MHTLSVSFHFLCLCVSFFQFSLHLPIFLFFHCPFFPSLSLISLSPFFFYISLPPLLSYLFNKFHLFSVTAFPATFILSAQLSFFSFSIFFILIFSFSPLAYCLPFALPSSHTPPHPVLSHSPQLPLLLLSFISSSTLPSSLPSIPPPCYPLPLCSSLSDADYHDTCREACSKAMLCPLCLHFCIICEFLTGVLPGWSSYPADVCSNRHLHKYGII